MANAVDISSKPKFAIFRSVKNKLLVLMIALSLLPLAGMAIFSYFMGKNLIQERIQLSLDKMAQDTADKVDLMLRGNREEIHSMATTLPLIYPGLKDEDRAGLIALLNNYCVNHDIYDVLAVLDGAGNFVGINTTDRDQNPLPSRNLSDIINGNISRFPEEQKLFLESMSGNNFHHDWYQSKIVQTLYDYQQEDRSHQYNIALSEPVRDPKTHEVIGVLINILNWSYFQTILDVVETDLSNMGFKTGYGFMIAKDSNTVIGHKYRRNRNDLAGDGAATERDNYGTRLIEDHNLPDLYDAIQRRERHFAYDFPKGNKKISGLAPITDSSFGWIVGTGIDESDIFKPVRNLTYWLLGVTVLLASLVVLFTYIIAEGITTPLKNLIRSVSTIARGNFNEKVPIRSSDELGILASTFNKMARALSARETQLQELNRNLESMVRDRTIELENSHDALKRAYIDLQNAQEQLVQTEKMASLGQLVAGIAHEIKNPLNFIYGNTGFLADYIHKLQKLVESFEKLQSISAEDREQMNRHKESIHYSFIQDDLKILISNFSEGAQRINTIVSDLRAFSRMDTDAISEVDIHASLEMSLNLLRNQYKNRIEIHKEYGDIPKIQGYSGKLNQVLMNLLSNAFHAVRERGEVWIRTRPNNGAIEIEIEDNGSGIPTENLKRIFEPFFTTKPVGQGTGLGLSISYGIIEQHGGKIHVTSTPQKGSTFLVRLPIFQEKAQ
jgi:two-component system NtrC family sensor kinase